MSMINVEEKVIQTLKAHNIKAYADVPKKRPDEFVTVESLGGSSNGGFIATPGVAVRAWAQTKYAASQLALTCREAIRDLETDANILSLDIGVPYSTVSEDGLFRYQVDTDITTYDR